jgi:hypothetical protein
MDMSQDGVTGEEVTKGMTSGSKILGVRDIGEREKSFCNVLDDKERENFTMVK